MSEQELIEKVAQREAELHQGYYNRKYGYHRWDKLPPVMRAEIYDNANQIFALIKEAGYKSPEEVADILSKYLAALKEAGHVKLVEDLSLPELDPNDPSYYSKLEYAGKIIRAGWRKVKLAEDQSIGATISYLLGLHGQMSLYDNYPNNFNKIINLIEDDMLKAGWRRVILGE